MLPSMLSMLQPTVPSDIKAHGPAIREFRKRAHLSIEQVASHIGVTRFYLSRVERNERGARRETLEALSAALGVPLDVITYPESR
jgi:transcriptional regulator with XRE-family HTH domain